MNGGGFMRVKQVLYEYVKGHKWQYIIGTVLLILGSFISSLVPKVLGTATDLLNQQPVVVSEIYKNLFLLIGISVSAFIIKFFWRYFLIGSCRSLECYLREKLFKHLQSLSVDFYNNNKTGDLIALAINDIQAIRRAFGFGIVGILEGVIINAVAIIYMSNSVHPVLTLMAFVPAPLVIFLTLKLRMIVRERFEKVQAAFADISARVQENICGIRVIKSFAQEKEEIEDFSKVSQARVDTQMNLIKISALINPLTQVCFGISFLLFIIYGSELVIKGVITIGDYVAFNSYILLIMRPITHISRIVEIWQRGFASIKRLDRIFSIPADIGDGNGKDVNELHGSIVIKDLNFRYPGTKNRALKNINIHLEKGKTLGILGRTGSGKTTFVELLLRLYEVERGHIFIDHVDINDIPIDILREKIGYVPQDSFLFSTTIRNNIEFFRDVYTDEEIEEAARNSGIYESILSFKDGFETMVGERGVTLSGGQKQRIAIARALIKNPSIIILDDSLSAVDAKTESQVLKNIKNFLRNRTGIIISHRVSTVSHADEIIFMDRGRIVERGSHEELMALKGHYYHLYQEQMSFKNGVEKEFSYEC